MSLSPPRDALLEVLRSRWEERAPAISPEHVERVREHLLRTLPREALSPFSPEAQRRGRIHGAIRQFLEQRRIDLPPSPELVEALYSETAGLGPLEALLSDPEISEILVEGWDSILVERAGTLARSASTFRSPEHLDSVVQRLVLLAGKAISPSQPLLGFAWQDGSRIQATVPPVSPDGPTLTLRRFRQQRFTLPELVGLGSLTPAQAALLEEAMAERRTLLVGGPVSSGKTTLIEALLGLLPLDPPLSVLLIEDVPEIRPSYPHLRRLLVPAESHLTLRELTHAALRMRPDLIVIGETRGPEAADLVYALSSGLAGGLTSIHAASPAGALRRLVHYVQMDPHNPFARQPELLMAIVAEAVDLVLQLGRDASGRRRLEAMASVRGLRPGTADFELEPVVA